MSTSPAPGLALTDREHLVLAHIACGHTNADIGRETGLSEDTVKSHTRALYRKLGARDRPHAVALAYQRGLLDGHRRGPVVIPTVVVLPSCADPAAYPHPAGHIPASVGDGAAFARAVGYALRAERKRRHWTLSETGAPIGLSVSVLCRVELGVRPLDMHRLVGLCAVLGVAPARVIAVAQAEAFPLDWPRPGGGHGAMAPTPQPPEDGHGHGDAGEPAVDQRPSKPDHIRQPAP